MAADLSMKDLLAAAIGQAHAVGLEPPTVRMVADWIDEGLISRGTPMGNQRGVCPTWVYSEEALEVVKKVVSLKAQGCRRYSALRICLAVHGHKIEFGYLPDDLKCELRRFRNGFDRKHPSAFDIRFDDEPSDIEKKRASRQLARVFEVAGLSMSDDIYARLISWSKFGASSTLILPAQSGTSVYAFEGVLRVMFANSAPFLNFGGVLGQSEEIDSSGEEILARITKDDFDSSAENYWSLLYSVSFAEAFLFLFGFSDFDPLPQAFASAAVALSAPEWLINSVVIGAISSYRRRSHVEEGAASYQTLNSSGKRDCEASIGILSGRPLR